MTWREEARARLDAATPGPWTTDGMHPEVLGPDHGSIISVVRQPREVWERGQDRDRYGHGTFPDIEFIAAAPEIVRRALDALDRIDAALEPKPKLESTYPSEPGRRMAVTVTVTPTSWEMGYNSAIRCIRAALEGDE